jgi:apolipoprotein N-acyltransferase
MRAVLYPRTWRAVTGMLSSLAGGSLLVILLALLLSDRPVNPLRLMRLVAALCLVPRLAVLTLRRACTASLRIEADTLVIEQRHRRLDLPVASVAAIEPWLLPLPGSGLWLRLRSGRRWTDGLELEDPTVLIDALAVASGAPGLRQAARHPFVVYARARGARRRSWRRALLEFPIFALVPTIPLFRVHQIIAYGGALGEYYQYSLGAYLAGFAIYWATLTIYLMLYAAALRVPVELLTVAAAALAPTYASAGRRLLDRLAAVLYYVGVPAAVALRFAPW